MIFPEMPRPEEGGAENKVRNTLNFLLKKAVAKCLPDFDLGLKPWTTIRHTAFRLMLEDDPSLWVGHKLRDFAINGHTSPDQLQTTYITPIQSEKTAKEPERQFVQRVGQLKESEGLSGILIDLMLNQRNCFSITT